MTDAGSLAAVRSGDTGTWSGVWLAEDVRTLTDGIASGSWIDTAIGGFASTMDSLALLTDPLGTVAQWGAAWLIEHVRPLREALDALAGDPGQITAYAQTWRNVAAALDGAVGDTRTARARDLTGWTGVAADAYRSGAGDRDAAVDGLARAACGLAAATECAGLVVAQVRTLVRDLIASFVSTLAVRLPEWLAEAACTLGLATPWVVAQVSTLVAQWGERIARLLRALSASVGRLAPMLERLTGLIGELAALLRRFAGRTPSAAPVARRARPPTDWESYEAAVRADHQGAPRLTYEAGGKERITDVGVIEATTEQQFGSAKLDQLWSDLVQHNRIALTVPQLTATGERRLAKLVGIYQQTTGRRPIVSVRETGP